jgi:hypothetical protein
LKAGAWLRRVRFVIISPVPRHHRRVQAEIPLIPVFEFGQPPLPSPLRSPFYNLRHYGVCLAESIGVSRDLDDAGIPKDPEARY